MKKPLIALFVYLAAVCVVNAELVTNEVEYTKGDTVFKGFLAYDNSISGKCPGTLEVHEWWGHNDYARKRARMLAQEGYTALSIDMYGDGKTADHPASYVAR